AADARPPLAAAPAAPTRATLNARRDMRVMRVTIANLAYSGQRRVDLRLMTPRMYAGVLCAAIALTAPVATGPLPQDRDAAGVWQKLLKLQTIASAMHTTAHPDDEQGGVLAWLSRGVGARVALATLTRGESGDNAIGPELFDAVGLI